MGLGDVSLGCAWALVDELTRGGVRHACLSPGSRSTPLALALARHPAIELHVHLDERAGAFVALGLARATRRPVVVACTSGTAAAELLPAVVEASRSRVPLILLTADRPPRLRGTGANQTIDQVDLYGSYADYLEPPVPAGDDDASVWREVGRVALLGIGRTTGPVQVNCPFEEPLTPSDDLELGANGQVEPRPLPQLEPEEHRLSQEDEERLAAEISGARGAIVVGSTWPLEGASVNLHAVQLLGWPIIAEPTSGCRRPGAALAAGQALIGDRGWLADHRPEVVLQLGAAPTTRTTQAFVGSVERLIVADRVHPDPDPEHRATWRLRADIDEVLRLSGRDVEQRSADDSTAPSDVSRRWERRLEPAPREWLDAWQAADRVARRAVDDAMDGWDEPFEPRIARDVAAWAREGSTLFVGNSTPVRDLDLTMAPREGLRVIANRGASGIDGSLSTAIGVATAGRGPTVALLGDLTFLYDAGSLLWSARRSDVVSLVVVVVANGGGEIFSLLPQRSLPEHRELFVTPHVVDIGGLCEAAGAGHRRVERMRELNPALDEASGAGGIQVVEVVVDPERDRMMRDQLSAHVAVALRRRG
jgi:2-succinyl-5-enolpyruvyl-6-hydroxy-3-cyclohexene-1-carboxylate synthase